MTVAIAWLVLEAAVLFVGGVLVLVLACAIIGRAAAEVSRARVHHAQAKETLDATTQAFQAIDDTEDFVRRTQPTRVPPTDEEIKATIIARRTNGHATIDTDEPEREHTTMGNAGVDDSAIGFGGGSLFSETP